MVYLKTCPCFILMRRHQRKTSLDHLWMTASALPQRCAYHTHLGRESKSTRLSGSLLLVSYGMPGLNNQWRLDCLRGKKGRKETDTRSPLWRRLLIFVVSLLFYSRAISPALMEDIQKPSPSPPRPYGPLCKDLGGKDMAIRRLVITDASLLASYCPMGLNSS